ncbi:MAG: hypothetical protein JOZ29_03610 [Deltaproteobacteria bacterium]|nr:hypothetical protein [Deltaproteobacteria bacterium]
MYRLTSRVLVPAFINRAKVSRGWFFLAEFRSQSEVITQSFAYQFRAGAMFEFF